MQPDAHPTSLGVWAPWRCLFLSPSSFCFSLEVSSVTLEKGRPRPSSSVIMRGPLAPQLIGGCMCSTAIFSAYAILLTSQKHPVEKLNLVFSKPENAVHYFGRHQKGLSHECSDGLTRGHIEDAVELWNWTTGEVICAKGNKLAAQCCQFCSLVHMLVSQSSSTPITPIARTSPLTPVPQWRRSNGEPRKGSRHGSIQLLIHHALISGPVVPSYAKGKIPVSIRVTGKKRKIIECREPYLSIKY